MKRKILFVTLIVSILIFQGLAFANSNYILIGKDYYKDISNYKAGFLNEKITEENLIGTNTDTALLKILKPNDMLVKPKADFTQDFINKTLPINEEFRYSDFPFNNEETFKTYLESYNPTYSLWVKWFKEQMPDISKNTEFIGKTYDYFYKNKKFNNAYINMEGAFNKNPLPSNFNITNTLSPEDTTNYVFNTGRFRYTGVFKGQKRSFYTQLPFIGDDKYIYPGINIPKIPNTKKVMHRGYYTKSNTFFNVNLYEVTDKLYFSYLFVGDEKNNQIKFNDNIFSNYNIGYQAKNKIPGLMLNKSKDQFNNFIIPARYNKVRDDLLIAYRGSALNTGMLPHFSIDISDDNGKPIINGAKRLTEAKTAVNFLKQHYQLNLNAASQFNYQIKATTFNRTNGVKFIPLKDALKNLNEYFVKSYNKKKDIDTNKYLVTGITSSIGNNTNLKLFYRDGIDEENNQGTNSYKADTLSRNTDSKFNYNISHKVTQKSEIQLRNIGDILNQNDTLYKVEFIRPVITSNSVAEIFDPLKDTFDNDFGINSITVTDKGISNYDKTHPKYKEITVDLDRVRVLAKKQNETNYSKPLKFNELKTLLTNNKGSKFELIYTYAGTDALDSIVGKLPNQINDNEGPYAVPLIRNVTVKGENVPTENKKVIVKYLDDKGNTISTQITLTGKLDEKYSTSSKEISGYRLIKIPNNKNGKFKNETIIVTYVYEKIVLPKTGSNSSSLYYIIGIAFMLTASLLYLKSKKS